MAKPKLGSGKRFQQLEGKLGAKGAKNPGALATAIGRKKYGKAKFQQLSASGKKKTAKRTKKRVAVPSFGQPGQRKTNVKNPFGKLQKAMKPQGFGQQVQNGPGRGIQTNLAKAMGSLAGSSQKLYRK